MYDVVSIFQAFSSQLLGNFPAKFEFLYTRRTLGSVEGHVDEYHSKLQKKESAFHSNGFG